MLSDYRVLDLTDEPGALCGQLLADLGAQVVRIEPPGGSTMRHGDRPAWDVYARNCSSLVLEGSQRFQSLAANADLVIASGAAEYAALKAANPRLVWVSITAFGVTGPKHDYHATDLIAQAASGAMAITGFHDSKPLRTGAITAWSHAGVAAAGGALLALRYRDKTGRGQLVDISAQSACNLAASFSLLTPYIGASRFGRAGNIDGGTIPLIWPALDGFVSMTLGFAGPMLGFAKNLLRWMVDEGALAEPLANLDWPAYLGTLRQGGDRAQLNALLDSIRTFLADRSKTQLLDGALRHGTLIVPVATTHDLLASPQLAERKFWWDASGVRMPGAFARFSARPLTLRRRAPALNDHPEPLFRPRINPLAPTQATATLPLDGINVLDFSWVMAGPWSTRVLADYGATVVKIESRARLDLVRILGPFFGDKMSAETSASFASINAGKHSFELDPGTPEGKATILALVDWADVVVESFSPKAMKKWGLDYTSLQAHKPDLIMLSTCLFGQTGPHAMMAGYGTMGAALGGLTLPTGEPGRPPCGPFGPYTDYVAPRFSVLAVLAALHHRDRTGQGQHIDQSQAESAMHYLSVAVAAASRGAAYPDRLANSDPGMCPHDVFRCAGDDQWVAIAIRDDDDWRRLIDVVPGDALKDARLATIAGRRAAEREIGAAITTWTASQRADQVEAYLQRHGIPAHAVTNAGSGPDPQLTHREHFVRTTHHQLGEVWIESVGYRFSDMQPSVGKIPSLGGDSDWVKEKLLAPL
jgi:crotonobetainyl-CoA:carnitine CoA-transferase CaiB-like acyl-CoA transferase